MVSSNRKTKKTLYRKMNKNICRIAFLGKFQTSKLCHLKWYLQQISGNYFLNIKLNRQKNKHKRYGVIPFETFFEIDYGKGSENNQCNSFLDNF